MTKERNNPWAGLASYEDPAKSERKLKFCGRDNDIYDVTRLIDDNLLLILYGKSGIGKTSLLNAGVFPELRKEQYLPVSNRLGTMEVSASYQEAIVYAIEKAIEEAHGSITVYHVVEEQTDNHHPDLLWNYFARHRFANAEGQPLFPVVVLDQFEEVLRNTSPEHVEKAQTLLNQLQYLIDESHALNDCVVDGQDYFYDFNFRFIISIREDELYLLEDNIDDLSLSMFRNCRYRLRSLSEQGATEAILLPGKDCIVEEQKQAVVDRVIELSKRPQSNDIDTLLLSLVCSGTFDKKVGEKIALSDLAVWKDSPMRRYYDEAILSLQENQIRIIQHNLIKRDGTRKRVGITELKEILGDDTFEKLLNGSNRILNALPNEEVELLHDQLALAIYDDREAYEERERNWRLLEMQSRFVAERTNRLVDEGDSYTARRLLLKVLPVDLSNPVDKPYTIEAEAVMRKACGNNTAILKDKIGNIYCALFSPDGKRIVSASYDKIVRIWDAETGAKLRTLEGHNSSVNSAAYSPDGKCIVTASWDNTVKTWDAETGEELRTLVGHDSSVNSAAYSPDGKCIVTASWDNTIRVWDSETGRELRRMEGHTSGVNSAAFSPNGKCIVSASLDSTVRIWDTETGLELGVLEGHVSNVYSSSFSPDGKRIISTSCDKTIKIWDVETATELKSLSKYASGVKSATYSPDGKCIVSASDDHTVRVWDAEMGAELRSFTGHASCVNSVTYSPDGMRIVSASDDHTVRIWDAEAGAEMRTFVELPSKVNSARYSPDGKHFVSASEDHTVRIWNAETGAELRVLDGQNDGVRSAIYSPDGKHVVSASRDGMVRIYDVEIGKTVRTLDGHNSSVRSVAYSPDGKRIVTASLDGMVRIWDVKTGKQRTMAWHTKDARSAAFSPDGERIVSASSDNTVRVWDAETGEEVRKLEGCKNQVNFATFSPDGKHIVSASGDKIVRIWDVETGAELRSLEGHISSVYSATYSPDGKRIVSASGDHTVRVWDAETGMEVRRLEGHENQVYFAAFSPDGKHIVSASLDKTIRIWDFPPLQDLIDQTRERFKNRPLTPEERRMYYLE